MNTLTKTLFIDWFLRQCLWLQKCSTTSTTRTSTSRPSAASPSTTSTSLSASTWAWLTGICTSHGRSSTFMSAVYLPSNRARPLLRQSPLRCWASQALMPCRLPLKLSGAPTMLQTLLPRWTQQHQCRFAAPTCKWTAISSWRPSSSTLSTCSMPSRWRKHNYSRSPRQQALVSSIQKVRCRCSSSNSNNTYTSKQLHLIILVPAHPMPKLHRLSSTRRCSMHQYFSSRWQWWTQL